MIDGRTQKTEWAKTFKENLQKSNVSIFANYRGLKAVDADEFRKRIRNAKGSVKVLKNNLARKAVEDGALGADAKAMMDGVVGPTLVAFSFGDAAALAKVIHEFAKNNEAFEIKGGLLASKKIAAQEIEALATLPSREVLLAKLLGTMQAPASNFVGVLAAIPRSLLNVLKAIEAKKAK
jgi:large subunit ribosomal protein L10